MRKRLHYKLSEDEKGILLLCLKLGTETPLLEIGMKIRATYIDPPFWFYGKITRVNSDGTYIDLCVERTSLPYFENRQLCFSVNKRSCWVEVYVY